MVEGDPPGLLEQLYGGGIDTPLIEKRGPIRNEEIEDCDNGERRLPDCRYPGGAGSHLGVDERHRACQACQWRVHFLARRVQAIDRRAQLVAGRLQLAILNKANRPQNLGTSLVRQRARLQEVDPPENCEDANDGANYCNK
jgi:hypothetical protein